MITMEIFGDVYTKEDIDLLIKYNQFINDKYNVKGNIYAGISYEDVNVLDDFNVRDNKDKLVIEQFMYISTFKKGTPLLNVILAFLCSTTSMFTNSFILKYYIFTITAWVILFNIYLFVSNVRYKKIIRMIDNSINLTY